MSKHPTYDELPIDPKYPAHSAWGLWGEDDNLGTLNLVTPERVAAARECIKKGVIFPMNWKLEEPEVPLFGRQTIQHQIVPHNPEKLGFDDWYDNYNPQSSSQWDGLRHVCHMPLQKYYNNISPDAILNGETERLGVHHMARRGIAGRAVLLDYARWAEKTGKAFDPFVYTEITVDELDAVAADQKVEIKPGDILIVRTGWIQKYEKVGMAGLSAQTDIKHPSCAGVKACEETFRWVWNHQISAVAGDSYPFEAFPPPAWENSCHSMFLGGWGMPIGEMFYLEKLAEDSAKDGVYEYFFTSAPLNKLNGVASPPNAICIK